MTKTLLILLVALPAQAATYYIDYNAANDSANGTTTSTPWKRCPGMVGFAGSHSYAAGDVYVFKGGVTWPVAALPLTINVNGTVNSRTTYRSDASWFTGASWSKPILHGGGSASKCISVPIFKGRWVSVSDFDIKAFHINGTWGYAGVAGERIDNITFSNLWIHGWTHYGGEDGGACGGVFNQIPLDGTPWGVTNVVVTHCDIGEPANNFTLPGGEVRSANAATHFVSHVRFSKIHHVVNGTLHSLQWGHDNEYSHIPATSYDGKTHGNIAYLDRLNGGASASHIPGFQFFNNYAHHCTSPEPIYPTGEGNNTGYRWFIYNNLYWVTNSKTIDIDTWTNPNIRMRLFVWNNTFINPAGAHLRSAPTRDGEVEYIDARNNLFIGGSVSSFGKPNLGSRIENNLYYSTIQAANDAGFLPQNNWRQTDAFSPVVATGVNLSASNIFAPNLVWTTSVGGVETPAMRWTEAPWDKGAFQWQDQTPIAPIITSTADAQGQNGVAFSYQITANGAPTSFDATGLPNGLSVDLEFGTITGTPNVTSPPTVDTVTLHAFNAQGEGQATIDITIIAPEPTIAIGWDTNNYRLTLTNTMVDRVVTVSNIAQASTLLEGEASNISSPWSVVGDGTYSLNGGQNKAITVRYTPTAVGVDSGTMDFTGGLGVSSTLEGTAYAIHPSPINAWAGLIEGLMGTNADGYISHSGENLLGTGGTAIFGFNVAVDSTIKLLCNVDAANGGKDSFYVNIDAWPTTPTNIWDVLPSPTSGYEDRQVHNRGATGDFSDPQYSNKVWTVTAGNHLIYFMGRETDCRLKTITIQDTPIGGTPVKATVPSPVDTATAVTTNVTLSWEHGAGYEVHFLYFGVDATPDETEFIQPMTDNMYALSGLPYATLHYWRVDSSNSVGLTTGDVYSFTTQAAPVLPDPASNPSPADAATSVALAPTLTWDAATGAEEYDVYFNSSGGSIGLEDYKATVITPTYVPGALEYATTYRFRVDTVSQAGTTEGEEWSFTTLAKPVTVFNGVRPRRGGKKSPFF